MANPFPGMNPYLEQSEFWSDVQAQMIAACARALAPQLVPKYRVVTDKWTDKITNSALVSIGQPDIGIQQRRDSTPNLRTTTIATSAATVQPIAVQVPISEEIQQSFLEVRDAATKEVVTAIELLSPANKRGEGRQKYEAKRQAILESRTHLIEIDLLRQGDHPTITTTNSSHYRILISRSQKRPTADLYAFNLGNRIPNIPIPLLPEDTEPLLDLQSLLNELYDQLGYSYFIDYKAPPADPWTLEDVAQFLP